MYERGLAIGAEARGKGVNILLGPVVGKQYDVHGNGVSDYCVPELKLIAAGRTTRKEASRWKELGRVWSR